MIAALSRLRGAGRGVGLTRACGLVLLAAVLVVQIGYGDGLDAPWRRLWFDDLAKGNPRVRGDAPVIIVAIDDPALAQYGQWPWPRSRMAELVGRIRALGASAIGIDILFVEPDRLSPRSLAPWLAELSPDLGAATAILPDTDAILADSIRGGRVVLAVTGQPVGAAPSRNDIGVSPAVVWAGPRPPGIPDWPQALQSLGPLQQGAEGFGAITADSGPDGVVRAVPAVQTIAGRDHLNLGLETLRIAAQGFFGTLTPGDWGLGIDLGGPGLRAEADGKVWLHWGHLDPDRYVSAVEVMAGLPRAGLLQDRAVLLAVTGLGTVDLQRTPLGESVYGIEAHAQLIEQVLSGDSLRRPAWVFWVETAVLVLFGLCLIALVPVAPPLWSVGVLVGVGATLVLGGWGAHRLGWLVDPLGPLQGGALVGVGLLALTLVSRDRARLQARIDFEVERAGRQRLQGSIDAAADIQASLLPPRGFRLPGRLDLACHIEPALDIGGDFFDHFLIDDHRLFFSVGDVSGKGVEASLFMALSKCLWKSAALRPGMSLGAIQTDANIGIARDNTRMMFVTGLAAILDLSTGQVWHSSCGHDQPYLFGPGLTPRQLDDHGGPAAGLDDFAEFPVGEAWLAPGQWLCLFTDGITEAMDVAGDRYGLDRLGARLGAAPDGLDAAGLIDWVLGDVRAFVGAAAQSDDLTLLILGRPATAPGTTPPT